jgi:hypothetical protein
MYVCAVSVTCYIHTVIHNTTVVARARDGCDDEVGGGDFNIFLDYYRWDISDISVELLAPNVCKVLPVCYCTPSHAYT